MLPRTVVVPLDGSSLAERALEPALALARGFGAPVRLVRATLERPADDAAAYLRQVAERFDLDPDDISVPIGFAANGIVDRSSSPAMVGDATATPPAHRRRHRAEESVVAHGWVVGPWAGVGRAPTMGRWIPVAGRGGSNRGSLSWPSVCLHRPPVVDGRWSSRW